jgi:hypothetical protein
MRPLPDCLTLPVRRPEGALTRSPTWAPDPRYLPAARSSGPCVGPLPGGAGARGLCRGPVPGPGARAWRAGLAGGARRRQFVTDSATSGGMVGRRRMSSPPSHRRAHFVRGQRPSDPAVSRDRSISDHKAAARGIWQFPASGGRLRRSARAQAQCPGDPRPVGRGRQFGTNHELSDGDGPSRGDSVAPEPPTAAICATPRARLPPFRWQARNF